MSNELIEFIKARLDEDEQAARAVGSNAIDATEGMWGTKYLTLHGDHPDRHTAELPAELADHIARHDPARALREVEAKRRVLARHTGCGTGIGYCDDGGHAWDDEDGPRGCADLADLVAVYSDHPQFREEWRL